MSGKETRRRERSGGGEGESEPETGEGVSATAEDALGPAGGVSSSSSWEG